VLDGALGVSAEAVVVAILADPEGPVLAWRAASLRGGGGICCDPRRPRRAGAGMALAGAALGSSAVAILADPEGPVLAATFTCGPVFRDALDGHVGVTLGGHDG
jgi:hypothetical protein